MAVVRTVACCAILWAGAAAIDGVGVKQQVEKIFKSVEQYLAGRETQPVVGEKQEPPAEDRAFVDPVPFPIGVITSDNLYPMVVGKHVDSGLPFVMNLNQQHALVVARAGGDQHRMVIPYPVVKGDSVREEDRGRSPAPYGKHYTPSRGYPRHGNKYLPSVQTHRQEELFRDGEARHSHPPGNYHRIANSYGPEDRARHPQSQPRTNSRNTPQLFTYYVEGPKYHVPLVVPRYNTYLPLVPVRNSPYRPDDHSSGDSRDYTSNSPPEDFKPSPYIGNITDDDRGEPQAESYDDGDKFTEQDYLDSIRDR